MAAFTSTGGDLYTPIGVYRGNTDGLLTSTNATHNWTTLESTTTFEYDAFANDQDTPGQHTVRIKTGSGLTGGMKLERKEGKEGLHPRLYFKYVKSKMTKLQKERLKDRLGKLRKIIPTVKELGQQALYETLAKELALIVKQSEIVACGIELTISKVVIERFRYSVNEQVKIGLVELSDYDRLLPDTVVRKIRQCWKYGLFHKYWVLYTDHKVKEDTDGKKKKVEKLKTNEQKIKEKDPILFGTLEHDPDTFYFIADWEDEYCDLTLSKFLDTIREDDPEFAMDRIPEIDEEMVRSIIAEVDRKEGRLANTNSKNFKMLAEEEKIENSSSMSPTRKKIALARLRAGANVKEAKKAVKKTGQFLWKKVSSVPEAAKDTLETVKDFFLDKFRR